MPEAETAHLADEEIKLCWIIQAEDEGRAKASLTGIQNVCMQSAFAYWEIPGKHLLLSSSVTDQSYAQHKSSREMWNHLSISYAEQLCKQPDLGREETEEHSHLTWFNKNT